VVERLHQLLADERIGTWRLELPFRGGGRERDREASALTRNPERSRGQAVLGLERDHDVLRLREQRNLVGKLPALV
jgi:hypothetical protein